MTYLIMSPGKLRIYKIFNKESKTGVLVSNLLQLTLCMLHAKSHQLLPHGLQPTRLCCPWDFL